MSVINLDDVQVIDLEEHAKAGKNPPKAERYRIRIDKERYVVSSPCLSGRELLSLAGKAPVEQYQVFQKLRGGELDEIGLDEKADFTKPGVERFVTLPLDQGEGA